ncbi:MAG: class I tRNA ligase family protein, partial [Candidatus Magasanikbacteria bacterium]|nr:class I tRNA ligase family protein [Candidatus Magasanikbacteria bacterium]
DIHCGGIDHIPVHHTNEIAQAEAAGANKPWVNFWLHGEFLNIKGAKMSKSDDNFLRLQTILDKGISPLSYRYFLLQAHYRKQLVFSWEALEAADNGLKNLRKQIALLTPDITTAPEVEDAIKEALYDDLNTAEALGLLSKHIKTKTISREIIATFDEVFALDLLEAPEPLSIPEDIEVLIEERKMAREQKDWKKSDDIRNLIQAKGFLVEDTIDGQTISLS